MDGVTSEHEAKTAAERAAAQPPGEHAEGTTVDTVDIGRIMRAIPHRYPFLLIDRVVDMVMGVSAIGVKNVSVNENYFQGHFPGHPVMPGVLIIESMAQTAAVLVVETLGPAARGKVVYFMSVENAKFRRPVVPGDQLRIHVTKDRRRGNVWKFTAVARVDGVSVAEATYAAMIMDRATAEAEVDGATPGGASVAPSAGSHLGAQARSPAKDAAPAQGAPAQDARPAEAERGSGPTR